MAWRKVHLGGEVWEWMIGSGGAFFEPYIVVRSPSRTVSSVPFSRFGFKPVKCPTCGQPTTDSNAVTPGKVKEYIERNKPELSEGKPARRFRRNRSR
jgi:hypothetical protein